MLYFNRIEWELLTVPKDNETVAEELLKWESFLHGYALPRWEDIPDIGLYMEQVIVLLTKYLDFAPQDAAEEPIITAATINNYVRKKLMPKPIKKKYYRVHIARLIVICLLKHSLHIPDIRDFLQAESVKKDFRSVYEAYAQRHRAAMKFFVDQVHLAAASVSDARTTSEPAKGDVSELIALSAIISGYTRLLTEKLLFLKGKTPEDEGGMKEKTEMDAVPV